MHAPNRTVAMLAALVMAGTAQAACPLQDLIVTGSVVAAGDGAAIAGASVEAAWDERATGRMQLTRESATDGSFSLRIAFDTYSGRTFGGRELCEAQLETIELSVTRSGFRPLRRTQPRASLAEPLRVELSPAS